MASSAILLANLGSPVSYQVKDVRKYLAEFLMDERVIDIPLFARTLLVKGIIVPFRAPKSAAKYKTIWTENGSPLIHISRQVRHLLEEQTGIPVELCMRYCQPSPGMALENLQRSHPQLKEVVLVPLYPHYAMSSYETAVVHVEKAHREGNYPFALKVIPPFYNHQAYIASLADSVRPHLSADYDHVLFSYHGVPERHILKSDPSHSHCLLKESCCDIKSPAHSTCYRHQVTETTRLVAHALGLKEGYYSFSFQSRLGRDAWLQPYTAAQLSAFPSKGIKRLLVLSPAFVSDCLETLEEIQMEGKNDFLGHGGTEYKVVPCLNTREDWIKALERIVRETMSPEMIKAG